MKNTWNIRVWGVRGSFPVPDARFLAYGGNTSCISVEYGKRLVVLDAGSGLVSLGNDLYNKGKKRVDILLSHLHIDHVIGLFKFKLLYDPEAEIHLYGEPVKGISLLKSLEALVGVPYWPLGLSDCPAHIEVHEVQPGEHFILPGMLESEEDIQIDTLRGNHPLPTLLYRLESKNAGIVYGLDCEMNEAMFHSLAEFSRASDLIIWDANFTEKDLKRHKGWGHSSWEEGISLCHAADVKKILMTHYSSEYTDDVLKNEEYMAKQRFAACCFAREGMRIQV